MAKTDPTKQALIVSFIAIALCCVLFCGASFAWFTDTGTTGVNTVTAGRFGVEAVNGDGESLAGRNDVFVLSGGTATATFKLVNYGNLPRDVQVVVNGLGTGMQVAITVGGVSQTHIAVSGGGILDVTVTVTGAVDATALTLAVETLSIAVE